ncbi:MAG TPA: NAD-dependent epimerase/dehydratase family protein [Sulfurihydrogenibium azorense]|uniref:NAD-dependent epimerase/dehydratase family protein n=1 Tax=Sulfurihydrogenibium azorense TaxID=309806 RepID=A0A831YAA7_9AQUI|nr:NAD-dependent epimerase/dehydratase family protein [Sulfurihydrogenibium azorense]
MKKVLLTGAAGFIGWRTGKFLLEKGVEVVGIDNMNDYYDVRLKEYRKKDLEKYENFKFYKVDIENLGALEVIFSDHKFDCVLNLAARAGVRYSMLNPFVYMTTNANGTLNLLELMKKYQVKKMVLASTSSLYAGQPMPFKEDLPVNTPISPYAASKKAAEVMAYTYHYLYGIDVSVVRYFTVYGPAGRPDMSIFRFIKWIDEGKPIILYGDGSQARDFTYVDDIAEGTILATKELGYEIINLGGGKNPISLKTVIETIEKHLGKKAKIDYRPFHKADLKETWADITKAEKLLGWKPKVSFEEGIKITVEWYIENREFLKDVEVGNE